MAVRSFLQACASVSLAAAWKVVLIGTVLGLVLLSIQQHRQARLRRFCEGLRAASSRADVQRGARESGFYVSPEEHKDVVATGGPAWGLSWCYVRYKDGHVQTTRFAHE